MQLYTAVAFENEISYNANLQALIKQIREASSEEKAKGIPTLPDELYYDMLPDYPAYEYSLTMLPVGIDVVDLEVKYLDVKKEPALIIGNSGMGRTNTLRNILHHLAGQQICLFDNKSGDLMAYANQANLHYAGVGNAKELLKVVKEVITKITKLYEDTPNQTLTLKAFGQSLKPVFIIIDGVQELNESLGDENIDVLAEAVQCGVYVIVTADLKFKVKKGKLIGMLTESKHGLVVGNLKEQGVFSSGGLREENRQVDLGYYHVRGDNQKIKLIEYMEQEMKQIEANKSETARI